VGDDWDVLWMADNPWTIDSTLVVRIVTPAENASTDRCTDCVI